MKKANYFFFLFIFIQKIKLNEPASFKCDLIVQKIRKEAQETINELHKRLQKESDGENMLQKYRILETKQTNTNKINEDQSQSAEEEDTKLQSSNSKEEELNNTEKLDEDEHEITIKDLEEKNQTPNKLIEDKQIKSKYIQDTEGYQYLNYFKCTAKGSYYIKDVNFTIDCQKQRDLEVYIYKGDKIAKKLNYKFDNYFSNVDKGDEKEASFPEFGYTFDNPDDFIFFKTDNDNCILRVSRGIRLGLGMMFLIFIVNF